MTRPARPSLALTALEAREVPAALSFAAGTLTIDLSQVSDRQLAVSAVPVSGALTPNAGRVTFDGVASGRTPSARVAGVPGGVLYSADVTRVRVVGSPQADRIDLSGVSGANGWPDLDGRVEVFGGGGNDRILGSNFDDRRLDGGDGDDTVLGQNGDDTVLGGAGRDRLFGDWDTPRPAYLGYGHDYLDGGAGNDTLTGGLGYDTLIGGAGADEYRGDTLATDFILTDAADKKPAGGAWYLYGEAW